MPRFPAVVAELSRTKELTLEDDAVHDNLVASIGSGEYKIVEILSEYEFTAPFSYMRLFEMLTEANLKSDLAFLASHFGWVISTIANKKSVGDNWRSNAVEYVTLAHNGIAYDFLHDESPSLENLATQNTDLVIQFFLGVYNGTGSGQTNKHVFGKNLKLYAFIGGYK